MMKKTALLATIFLSHLVFAAPPETPITPQMQKIAAEEKEKALQLKGDIARGKKSYMICAACHLDSGSGQPDGSFPQIAGQHSTVIIKQMADIRGGLRDNPIMYSFAVTMENPQETADVSAYIQTLCIPSDNSKYKGGDLAARIAEGKQLYDKQCANCHGIGGEGNREKFYPVIAGQHYNYLLRQMKNIRDNKRRNADPEMVKIIAPYTNEQLISISAYQASLKMPGAMCKK